MLKKCSKGCELEEMNPDGKILIVVGPTASGKTDLVVRFAEQVDGEIVNAGSMLV